jgi:hypothetical protein
MKPIHFRAQFSVASVMPDTGYQPEPSDDLLPPATLFLDDLWHIKRAKRPPTNDFLTKSEVGLDRYIEQLKSLLAERGESEDQLIVEEMAGEDVWNMVWPRNIKWNELPFVSSSLTALKFSPITFSGKRIAGIESDDIPTYAIGETDVVRRTRHVIVWSHWKDTTKLRGLLSIWDKRKTPLIVSFFDGESLETALPEYATDIKLMHEAEERFIWNYKLNFILLCSRAVAKVAGEFGADKQTYFRTAPQLNGSFRFLANPVALQILFALQDTYSADPISRRPYDQATQNYEHKLRIGASPFSTYDSASDTYSIRVTGSGTYPEIFLESLGFSHSHCRAMGSPLLFEDYRLTLAWLSTYGYAHLDNSNAFRLTPMGKRLLDVLGPSLNDPDIFLRWRDAATGHWRSDAIPAIDRWINRAFRAVKRRVAGLPSAPVIERPVPDWDTPGDGREVIFGRFKRIDKTQLSDTAFKNLVEHVESLSRSVSFKDREFGISRDTLTVDGDDTPYLFWVGVPIGIFSGPDFSSDRVGPVADCDVVSQLATRLIEEHGERFLGDWETTGLGLFGIGRTNEKEIRYFKRATSAEHDSGIHPAQEEWDAHCKYVTASGFRKG